MEITKERKETGSGYCVHCPDPFNDENNRLETASNRSTIADFPDIT